jgi:TRAP transporter TAXI family solute receptor
MPQVDRMLGSGMQVKGSMSVAAVLATVAVATAVWRAPTLAQPQSSRFPAQLVWSTPDAGSPGHQQASAIGAMLRQRYQLNLRLLPGNNDLARLTPLRDGVATLALLGAEALLAQEGVLAFGTADWGPQPLRALAASASEACSTLFLAAADSGIRAIGDLAGKRVALVTSAPAQMRSADALLAFAGLALKGISIVPVGGEAAGIDAVVEGRAIAALAPTNASAARKLAASPRGLAHVPLPHADTAGWRRLGEVAPWLGPRTCREGVGLPATGVAGAGMPDPVLVAYEHGRPDLVHDIVRALHAHAADYRDVAPGAAGWELARQPLAELALPFHEGAIRAYREAGAWTTAAQRHHDGHLLRQKVLQDAWRAFIVAAPRDARSFKAGWIAARAKALERAGLPLKIATW